jgi:hypothetical protein
MTRERLAQCAVLCNPAAGSYSLLSAFSRALHNERRPLLRHNIWLAAAEPEESAPPSSYALVRAPCILLSVRDPAARLRSGWRQETHLQCARLCNGHANHSGSAPPSSNFAFGGAKNVSSLSEWLRAFRSKVHPEHRSVLAAYLHSVALPRYNHKRHPRERPAAGLRWAMPALAKPPTSLFLVPQFDYLKGVTSSHGVYVLCTVTLSEDWSRLAREAGARDALAEQASSRVSMGGMGKSEHGGSRPKGNPSGAPLLGVSRHSHDRSRTYPSCCARSAELSEEEEEYIRRQMYPWDDDLRRTAGCRRERTHT